MAGDKIKYKIAAVVVTFNRLQLLKHCIEALRSQTYKLDEIIVVNNSSTDGTLEWLNEQKDLTVITQENSGSAGGQYTGIKTAFEKGYDLIWCMDDDCIALTNAMEELVKDIEPNTVLNCLVLSKTNSDLLAFGLYDLSDRVFYSTLVQIGEKKTIDYASLFNGTLLPASLIKQIGLPIKELFIKGEEIEYFHRIRKNGYSTKTIVSSQLFHPSPKLKLFNTALFNHRFEFLDKKRRFFRAKNFVYNFKTYRNFSARTFLKILLLDIWGIIFYQRNLSILFSNLKGLAAGLSANYKIEYPSTK